MRKMVKIISIILPVALLFETQMVKVTASEVETNESPIPYSEVFDKDVDADLIEDGENKPELLTGEHDDELWDSEQQKYVKKTGFVKPYSSATYELSYELTYLSSFRGDYHDDNLNTEGVSNIVAKIKGLRTDTMGTLVGEVSGDLVFPSQIDGYDVVYIWGDYSRYDNPNYFKNITVPNTVRIIDHVTFEHELANNAIGTITLGDHIEILDHITVRGIYQGNITIPESVKKTFMSLYGDCSGALIIGSNAVPFPNAVAQYFVADGYGKIVNKSNVPVYLPGYSSPDDGVEIVYVYETNGEQLEETENDSYVFVLDAGKTAVRKQISTQPHSEDENTNLQTWGFSNTEDNYGNPANGYCISKADYNRLLSNLPATAKADMENNYNIDGTGTVGSEWGGSCYGMSTSTLRVNDKNDAVSDYALGSKIAKLNDVKAADEQFKNNGKDSVGKAESVINFYHYQQLLPEYQNVRSTFAGYTKKEQITAVANLAKAAQSTKKPAVVDLWWNDGDDILGHSINAIGYRELASNESLYATYPHCILTYDCSNPDKTGNNSVCNIYFDDEGNWTVPGWEITPANAHMICGSGNPSVVGPVDYKTGTYAPSADMPASVSYDGDDDAWELKWGDNEAEVDGTDLTENITNDDVVTVLPEATDQNDHEYRIYIPENNDYTIIGNMIDHTVRVDDRMIKVNAEQGGEATVKQNGEVSVEANEEGKIMIEIISDNDNDNAPSHVILSVDNADNLIGQITDDGLIVKGDDLSSLEIRSDNIKTTVHSEESAVLVVQNDDGTIRIFEDKNDDGVFDDPAIIESAGFSHATVPEQTYTGKAIVPDVLVYHENTLLKQNIDYTIKFTNNVNVGSNATYTITGKGNYSGKETDTFQIVEKDIGDEDVTASEIASKAYDKKAYKPVPAVTYNGKKLAANKDFTVAYYKNAACTGNAVTPLTAGKYYAKVTGIKNYKGQKIIPFDIAATGKIPVSKLTIAAIPATQYTGGQITPKLSVKNGKTPLTENTEYTVTYGANTEVGVGTVTITGKELYVGTRTVTFNITGIPIAKAAVTCAKETFIYDGTPKTPTVTSITYDRGKIDIPCCTEEAYNYNTPEAQKKIGCLISYQNDIEAGKATMVLKGIHQCTGTVIKTYNIAPYNMTTDTNHSIEVSLAHTEYPFAKGTTKPKPTVTFNGRTLKEGVDYTLSYTNNKAVNDGTKPRSVPTVKVTGKKNFTGEKTATFKIVAANMQDAGVKVVANDVVYADKNGNWKTTLNLVDEEGKTLKSNTDYDLKNAEYRLGNETGELLTNEHRLSTEDVVYVKVPAKGINYTGYAEGTYRISRQNIAKLNATIKPKTYTGKRVTLTNTDIVWKGVSDQADVTYIIDETSYKNNTDKGKATVDVIGTGDFCGRKTITFTIGPKGILWWWNDLKN